jgi:hypothetical protein
LLRGISLQLQSIKGGENVHSLDHAHEREQQRGEADGGQDRGADVEALARLRVGGNAQRRADDAHDGEREQVEPAGVAAEAMANADPRGDGQREDVVDDDGDRELAVLGQHGCGG